MTRRISMRGSKIEQENLDYSNFPCLSKNSKENRFAIMVLINVHIFIINKNWSE